MNREMVFTTTDTNVIIRVHGLLPEMNFYFAHQKVRELLRVVTHYVLDLGPMEPVRNIETMSTLSVFVFGFWPKVQYYLSVALSLQLHKKTEIG